MLEREIKLHVPTRQRAGLQARLRELGAETIDLHAHYYDTADHALARARVALRLRREGDVWVQTIKTPGPDEITRVEWNELRPEPVLDLGVYADTHIGALMEKVGGRLQCRYVTQIRRLKKTLPTGSGQAELAYDEGAILANGIHLPVHELEIEGISGATEDLFALAQDWLLEHQLVIDLRSKAARGNALAALAADEGMDVRQAWDAGSSGPELAKAATRHKPTARQVLRLTPPVRAGLPQLPADAGIRAAYLECANDCMSQIVRNSSLLAGLDGMKTTHEQRIEYVHQIRVGIRRLRACWKLFGKAIHVPPALLQALRQHFGVLGQARDQDVIQTELLPRLMRAGMPPGNTEDASEATEESSPDRARLAATPEYQLTLLGLLEHLALHADAISASPGDSPAGPVLCARLNTWLERIRRDAKLFLTANWDDRHALRKRVKRLRYGMEFSQGVLDTKRLAHLRDALVSTQKALGQLNDLYVAAEYYRGAGARHPSAMFALGWLAATQDHEAKASNVALQELSRAGKFESVVKEKRRKSR